MPASQLGRPRSVCVIESRVCHVTSHRVFLWGHTAFDTLLSLFTLVCSALRKLDNHVVLLLGFLYLRSVERKRLRVHWKHRFGETGAQTGPSYAKYGKLVGHFSGEKQFCNAGYCKSILRAGTAACGYLNCGDCVLC